MTTSQAESDRKRCRSLTSFVGYTDMVSMDQTSRGENEPEQQPDAVVPPVVRFKNAWKKLRILPNSIDKQSPFCYHNQVFILDILILQRYFNNITMPVNR